MDRCLINSFFDLLEEEKERREEIPFSSFQPLPLMPGLLLYLTLEQENGASPLEQCVSLDDNEPCAAGTLL